MQRTKWRLILAVLFWLVPVGAFATPVASTAKPLTLESAHVLSSKRGPEIYLILNLFASKDALLKMTPAESSEVIVATAKKYVAEAAALERFKDLKASKVELVYIKSNDEYGKLDFTKVIRHGSLTFEKDAAGTFALKSNDLKPKLDQ